jgi:hypothetical protein
LPSTSSSHRPQNSFHSPGWRERSLFAGREGRLSFRHFDPYSQALAKLERGHSQDVDDVRAMLERGLIEMPQIRSSFSEIEPELFRFPAIDPSDFRQSVDAFLSS